MYTKDFSINVKSAVDFKTWSTPFIQINFESDEEKGSGVMLGFLFIYIHVSFES